MRLVEGTVSVDDLDGFLGDLDSVAAAHGVTVQAFDADYVVGESHLRRSVELADRAFARGENVARDRGVEVLCYAAGRRQINRALTMGVEEGENRVVVLADSETGDEQAEQAAAEELRDLVAPVDTLGEYDEPTVREFFDVGDAELRVVDGDLADVVLERVALLDVEK